MNPANGETRTRTLTRLICWTAAIPVAAFFMPEDELNDSECQLLRELRRSPELFAEIATQRGSELRMQQELRSRFAPELVRAAMTLADLRAKARDKFTRADEMWFTPKGLEQSTSEAVARHKAQRFRGAVWDFCCGIGSDAIGLAGQGCDVRAVDVVPSLCLRTLWNAECYDVRDRVDVIASDIAAISDRSGLLHIDPDRRPRSGQRTVRIEDSEPGLDVLQDLVRQFAGGAIKLGPATNFGGKFDDVEIELVSVRGECKEAIVWFGSLAGEFSHRATMLPSGETLSAHPLSAGTNVGELGPFLFDPDPAVVRAGLVDLLAERFGMRRLDAAEEYLTGDVELVSPFFQSFVVLENLPNNDREIRSAFRRQSFGQVEIKCRHIPIVPETVRRKLPLVGTAAAALIFTRQAGKSRAVLCRRIARTWVSG